MLVKKIGNKYFGRLKKGDEILQSLTDFCNQNNVKSGRITAIGATNKCMFAFFSLDDKQYRYKAFEGGYEITAINGDITTLNGQSFLHLHANICDEDFKAYGGHLAYAYVSATCEFVIEDFEEEITRELDPETGLNLIKL
jgi:uncharacterized protein